MNLIILLAVRVKIYSLCHILKIMTIKNILKILSKSLHSNGGVFMEREKRDTTPFFLSFFNSFKELLFSK